MKKQERTKGEVWTAPVGFEARLDCPKSIGYIGCNFENRPEITPTPMQAVVIGIAGGSGSGKTTVTNKIVEKLDEKKVVVIQHDSYYRDISTLKGSSAAGINFDHPDSLETP